MIRSIAGQRSIVLQSRLTKAGAMGLRCGAIVCCIALLPACDAILGLERPARTAVSPQGTSGHGGGGNAGDEPGPAGRSGGESGDGGKGGERPLTAGESGAGRGGTLPDVGGEAGGGSENGGTGGESENGGTGGESENGGTGGMAPPDGPVCVAGAIECVGDAAIRQCGEDGLWESETDCDLSCVQSRNECAQCAVGTVRCNSSNTPQQCTDGEWTDLDPACAAPQFICEATSEAAACVENLPFSLGESQQLPESTTALENWILGNRIEVQSRVQVLRLGLVAPEPGPACRVRMILFGDDAGSPADRIGYGSEDSALMPGDHQYDTVGQIYLEQGSYWLTAHYSCNAAVYGQDADDKTDLVYAEFAYGDVPGAFPAERMTVPTFAVNHYLVVQRSP